MAVRTQKPNAAVLQFGIRTLSSTTFTWLRVQGLGFRVKTFHNLEPRAREPDAPKNSLVLSRE